MSDSVMKIDEWGTKRWRNSSGQHHRIDGPAVVWASGIKMWYQNEKLHRLDGPAVESLGGYKAWYINDELLGDNEEGFWALWDLLTPEQKENPILLTYLPEKF